MRILPSEVAYMRREESKLRRTLAVSIGNVFRVEPGSAEDSFSDKGRIFCHGCGSTPEYNNRNSVNFTEFIAICTHFGTANHTGWRSENSTIADTTRSDSYLDLTFARYLNHEEKHQLFQLSCSYCHLFQLNT